MSSCVGMEGGWLPMAAGPTPDSPSSKRIQLPNSFRLLPAPACHLHLIGSHPTQQSEHARRGLLIATPSHQHTHYRNAVCSLTQAGAQDKEREPMWCAYYV